MVKYIPKRLVIRAGRIIGAIVRDDPVKHLLRIRYGDKVYTAKYDPSTGKIKPGIIHDIAERMERATEFTKEYLDDVFTHGRKTKKKPLEYLVEHGILFSLIALVIVTFYFYDNSITGYTTLSTAKVVNPLIIIVLIGIIVLLLTTKKLFKK